MSEPFNPGEVLSTLHRILIQLGDLKDRLDRGPRQIKAREAAVVKLEADLAQVKAESKAARMIGDQKQLLLKSGEAKLRDLNAKMNAAQSNREFQALKDQIAADEMANSVLTDEILETLEKIDSFKKLIADADTAVSRGKEDLQKAIGQLRESEAGLLSEVARCEGELRSVEQQLPVDFREPYMRLSRSKGADAMAMLEGDNCGGCCQVVTTNMYSMLLTGKAIQCQNCGRILYLPEDRRVYKK